MTIGVSGGLDRGTEQRCVNAIPLGDPVAFGVTTQNLGQEGISHSVRHTGWKRIRQDHDAQLGGWHEAHDRPGALAERAGMTPDGAVAAMLDVPAETVERWRARQWMVAPFHKGYVSLVDG